MKPRSRSFEIHSAMPPDARAPRWSSADALLLLTVGIWGSNFSVVKFGLSELPPLAFNAVRFLLSGATLALLTRAAGQNWRFQRRHLPFLIGLGLLGNTFYQLLFIYGVAATSADNAALILATVPAWVALGGSLAGLERVGRNGWLGVGLSFAGIVMIVLGADHGADFRFGGASLRGDGLMLLCTLCWSAFTLLGRLAMRHYRPLAVTSFCGVVGALPLVLLGLPDLVTLDRASVSAAAWAAAVCSGLFAIGLATLCWNLGVSRLGSARTSLYSNLTPPVALGVAWLTLGETLTVQQGWGALLAIAGVVLARRFTAPATP
jgi:drug/metabolite transporter (DMT)-like permease